MSDADLARIRDVLAGHLPATPATTLQTQAPQLATVAPIVAHAQNASAHAHGITFRDYCLSDDLDVERTWGGVIDESTFAQDERLYRQMARDGVPLDPPDAEAFMAWVNAHERDRASLCNHRKAYLRRLSYYGIEPPAFMRKKWDTRKRRARAVRDGKATTQQRFFRDPVGDVLRLLKGRPFRDDRRNALFRHAIVLGVLAAPRSAEPKDLKLSNVDAANRQFVGWWQEKKDYTRDVAVPEAWFWNGPGPSVKWYLDTLRPKLEPDPSCDAYFVHTAGYGYNALTYRNFVSQGQTRVLGYAIGGHALRRTGATLRRVAGWSVTEIAQHLDDTEAVVEDRYIDAAFVRRVGIRRRVGDDLPALPPLWKLPAAWGLEEEEESAADLTSGADSGREALTPAKGA